MQLHCLHRVHRGLIALAAVLSLTVAAFAAEAPTKKFDVPADKAAAAIKTFSRQAGVEVLFPTDAVAAVRTNATKGEMTPKAALETMVAGTGFIVVQDEKTGALGLRADPALEKNDDSRQDSIPAAKLEKTETGAIKLETYSVLGSRIRQAESAGPSPVSTYDRDYIRSTGAFTLADFLNQIPQNYSGISFGRASTPNELNPEFGQRTETTTPSFNFVTGSSSAPPGQTGVSGVSLRGLGSGSTLVLVDGRRVSQSGAGNRSSDTRQGFVDLNTIPLGMIERIEVSTDGASAIYGADAVAGVINIILKQNYTGTEINGGLRMAEHGGGRERNVSVVTGFTRGKWSGNFSMEYFDRASLKASQRDYSANQNHSAIPTATVTTATNPGSIRYGVDFRLNWGALPAIQAVGGTVSGNFDAIPGVRVVLTPKGATSTPAVSAFIPTSAIISPATVVNSVGQQRFNSAAFLDMIPESERTGFSGSLKYKFNEQLDAYANFRTSKSESLTNAQVAGNTITGSFGAAVTLPAAFNPFNQNVTVGMILPEWGSATQQMRTLADAVTAGVRGRVFQTWEWDLGGSWQEQKTRQLTRNFNANGLLPLLINADPAQRFNPFIDYTAPGAPSQAALLETLSTYPYLHTVRSGTGMDFSANGDLFAIWGGEVKMAFGGSTNLDKLESISVNYSTAAVPVATTSVVASLPRSTAMFAEFQVPIFGKDNALPLLSRLDVQLAGRREEVGTFSKSVPKVGVSWTLNKSLLVRGSWSKGFRAPGTTEYLVAPTTSTSTLSDPRRTPTSTTGVIVTNGSNFSPEPELSTNKFIGFVYEPSFVKNLSLQANYYETTQTAVLQQITAQTIVNNEALFTDRITRAAANATDISLNQPGQLTAVNRVFVNFGRVVNRSADVIVEYRLPWRQLGTWRVNLAASRTLEATRALAPGQPAVVLEDDTGSPPKWKLNSSLFWNKGRWNASAFLWFLDGFESNNSGNTLVSNSIGATTVIFYPTPSVAKLDLRAGYEFENGVWRGYGKGLRVGVGVSNVFDKKPPFSDTVWGFNAGIHSQLILGRAYEFSFVLPL